MKHMKFILLSISLLCGTVLGINPNPCEGVPGSDQFRNDWSSCATYFWCNEGQAVHTVPCPPGMGFDESRQLCTPDASTCDECPIDKDIAVANPNDSNCRSHYFCAAGVRTTEAVVCAETLRFNRVTGMCDLTENVPCFADLGNDTPDPPAPEPEPTPDDVCPPGLTGDYNSNLGCDMFIRCINGVQNGPFSCGLLHFNQLTRSCDLPLNISPPCEG